MSSQELPAGGRFTAYLPAERTLLAERAAADGCSENYLVRIGVRALLGLPIPPWARAELERNLEAGRPAAAT